MSPLYILAALLGAYTFLFWFLKKVNEWYYVECRLSKNIKKYLPPGDMGWLVVGNMMSFIRSFRSKDPDSFLYNYVTRYGRTGLYRAYLFGYPSVIVSTPETCRRVLTDDVNFKPGYPKAIRILTGERSFHNLSSTEHKRIRKLSAAPITGHDALETYIEYIEDIVVPCLKEWSASGRPIEFLNEMRKVAFTVIVHIIFGPDADFDVDYMQKLYHDYSKGLRGVAINLPGFTFYKSLKARKKLVNIIQNILNKERAALKNGIQIEKKNLVQMLIQAEDEDGKLEDADIIDLLITYLIAGHGSSSATTTWMMIYLESATDVLHKAREEQVEIIKRRPPGQKGLTLNEVKSMVYLHKVINETLRITSLSFAIFREAESDVEINGYMIPKGWKVLVWPRGVHLDPQIHKDPKKFDPSRFENLRVKAGGLLPFGGGPRYCPGSDLAKVEICIFLHYFLLGYEFERINANCKVNNLPVPFPVDNCLATITNIL